MLPVILSSLSACFKCFSHSLPDPITEPTDSNTDKKRCGQLPSRALVLLGILWETTHSAFVILFILEVSHTKAHSSSKPYFLQSVLLIREIFPQQLTGLSKQFSFVRKLRGVLTQNIFNRATSLRLVNPFFFFTTPLNTGIQAAAKKGGKIA